MIKLPDHRDVTIVVGTSVRKPLAVLKPYLDSLAWQDLPSQVRLVPCFVPDFDSSQQDAQQYLFQWVNERGGALVQGATANSQDFSDAPGLPSHQWGLTAMARVAENKNRIIQFALQSKADYVFFCDSDVVLDRYTLRSLLQAQKPICTAVYWTRWGRPTSEGPVLPAAPQVWLRHPYQLDGRGLDEGEFRSKLLNRGLGRVWGYGATTLISRKVLEAGIDFSYVPGVPLDGLMAGEDRHFCIRAERAHIDAYADCWPDIFHIYHADQDIPKIPAMVERLGREHPECPSLGDLVSLRLNPIEPLPVAPGRFQNSAPIHVRGRIGTLEMLPEIEERVLSMKRGEKEIIKASFPASHPVPFLRGRKRLIEISLFDCKANSHPPVVEDDLNILPKSGRYVAA